jgi:hypothetical protein
VLYTVYMTRFRTYKIALPPQIKTQEERGPQIDKTPVAKFLYRSIFKKSRYFGFCLYSYLVHDTVSLAGQSLARGHLSNIFTIFTIPASHVCVLSAGLFTHLQTYQGHAVHTAPSHTQACY